LLINRDRPVRRLPPFNTVAAVARRRSRRKKRGFCMSIALSSSALHHMQGDFVTYLSWYIACFHTGES